MAQAREQFQGNMRNLNYEKSNRQDTTHKVSSTLCILGTVNYIDLPGVFTI